MATMESRIQSLITAIGADYKAIFAAIKAMTITTNSSTTYTLALTDAGAALESSNASATTVTVPPNSSVAFPTGTIIEVCQTGAGQVTIAPGSGVTINSRGALTKIAGQWGIAYLRKQATDTWVLAGDLSA